MCDHCGCRSFAPIAELTADHVRILDLAWTVAEADLPDGESLDALRRQLVGLLDLHAMKEEMELFSGARFAFEEEDWTDMGGAHHEAMHRLGVEHAHPTR